MTTLYISNNRTEDMVGILSAQTEEERVSAGIGAQRMVWFAGDGDVVVLPRMPEDAFLDYVMSLRGMRRSSLRLVTPPPGELGEHLLSPDRLEDSGFLAELRNVLDGRALREIIPVHPDPAVVAVARALGAEDKLPGARFAGQSGTTLINSKAVFRAVAAGIGVPIAPGAVVTNRRDAVEAIESLLADGHSVILKKEHQIGGLGNEVVSRRAGVRPLGASEVVHVTDRAAVEEYVARRWNWLTGDRHDRLVVERYYEDSVALYGEYLITDDGIELIGNGEMMMSPVLSGIILPAQPPSPEQLAELLLLGRRMCEPFRDMGYRGVLSPDAILTPDGELLFTEMNARITGCSHLHIAIAECAGGRERLGDRVVLEQGGWRVPSFGAAVDVLDRSGLALDPATRAGVVLGLDLTRLNGTVRCCFVAEDLPAALEMQRRLESLSVPVAV
ncbi:hypothetical protein SAMN05216188_11769 [Lentzea xinjiangensis]|uniref:ATP-grasp domain-containing protein n=1 Tax=Lentzea xinjiangensis TaxID=402600 RepID=A0A1H9SZN0_9PSEU|nr:peptide ligase PGM1-related protein [Lentzea xinjiangensis]SER90316.1 hypothetical protein SAMN05216188_11769 [Lentzea xinjiangensis]